MLKDTRQPKPSAGAFRRASVGQQSKVLSPQIEKHRLSICVYDEHAKLKLSQDLTAVQRNMSSNNLPTKPPLQLAINETYIEIKPTRQPSSPARHTQIKALQAVFRRLEEELRVNARYLRR
jgi:hypothetical protein